MTVIDKVDVYYEAFGVGQIDVHNDGKLAFAYDKRWLATTNSFPLSVTLPLTAGIQPDQGITPWLANLLPEEQQLLTLSRALGLSSTDALAILKEIGGDTAGAISIGEPSDKTAWSYRPITDYYGTEDPQDALTAHFKDLGRVLLSRGRWCQAVPCWGTEEDCTGSVGCRRRTKAGIAREG